VPMRHFGSLPTSCSNVSRRDTGLMEVQHDAWC
jgi:hypothetical protein